MLNANPEAVTLERQVELEIDRVTVFLCIESIKIIQELVMGPPMTIGFKQYLLYLKKKKHLHVAKTFFDSLAVDIPLKFVLSFKHQLGPRQAVDRTNVM